MLNILYLVNKKTFIMKMSRVRFHGMKALGKMEKCNIHYSGIGWDDFDNNLLVQENIDKMGIKFDMVIVYKPLEMKNFKDVTLPKCIRYNEMYNKKWTLGEIRDSGCELVICHHLNDCEEYQKMNIKGVKFVYVGHCAEKTIFKDYGLQKKYDLMLGGCLNPVRHYPLRNRLNRLMNEMSDKYKVYKHKHPGYNLKDAHTDRYLIEFAKAINQSRIVLTDSGKPRSRFGKYIEVPACGTVLVADLPKDNADDYGYLIHIDMSMSDEDIKDKIAHYLENDDDYNNKVNKGLKFAKEYTQEKYAERLLKEIYEFIDEYNQK